MSLSKISSQLKPFGAQKQKKNITSLNQTQESENRECFRRKIKKTRSTFYLQVLKRGVKRNFEGKCIKNECAKEGCSYAGVLRLSLVVLRKWFYEWKLLFSHAIYSVQGRLVSKRKLFGYGRSGVWGVLSLMAVPISNCRLFFKSVCWCFDVVFFTLRNECTLSYAASLISPEP